MGFISGKARGALAHATAIRALLSVHRASLPPKSSSLHQRHHLTKRKISGDVWTRPLNLTYLMPLASRCPWPNHVNKLVPTLPLCPLPTVHHLLHP